MTLRILTPGLHTIVVDFGRQRHRSLGVPPGGAADRWSLAIGNALVGNPPDAPGLEITLSGPTLRADCDIACVLFGAPFNLVSDRRQLAANKSFNLRAGEELRINETPERCRAYFCVHGGLKSKPVLDSHSSLAPLKSGEEIGCESSRTAPRFIRPDWSWDGEPTVLRVLDGAQADWFNLEELYGRPFAVGSTSNRIGLRLEGESLSRPDREMVSEPVCPGAVQVTRDGQCIVLGIDSQTIGGYPKIAQLISADVDKLGQLRPGAMVRFQRVSLVEAEQAYHDKQTALNAWTVRLHESYRDQGMFSSIT